LGLTVLSRNLLKYQAGTATISKDNKTSRLNNMTVYLY